MVYAKITPIICTTKLLSTRSVYNVNHNLYTPDEPDAGSINNPEHPKYKSKPFLLRKVTHHAKWLLKRLTEKYAYFDNLYIVCGLSEGIGDPSIMERWIEDHRNELTRGFLKLVD